MPVTSALIKSHPDMNLNHVDLNQSNWTQSLFRRMKFVRRLSTTGKVPISESLHREPKNVIFTCYYKKDGRK